MLPTKNYFFIIASSFIITSCHSRLFGGKEKQLNQTKLDEGSKLKISQFDYRGNTTFTIHVQKADTSDTYNIEYLSKRYFIQKYTSVENGCYYAAVTDTANCKLKCLEYQFLASSSTPYVLATFQPITSENKKILQILSNTLQQNKTGYYLKDEEINRIIGWVKIYF